MTILLGSEVGTSFRPMTVPRASRLRIRRESIRWTGGIAGRPLKISFVVENLGLEPSAPQPVRIDVAPFGAFVPWRPLTSLTLPGIPPGGHVVMTATAGDDELPRRLDGPIASEAHVRTALLRAFRRAAEELRPVHMVGNLNVYVGDREPVERHMKVAIGLQAGAENWSFFFIGDDRLDSYTLRPEAEPGWQVDIEPGSWGVPMPGPLCVAVKFVPPAHATSGRVAIWVRRESTGQEVPVEFELSANAPAAHCYQR